jgi:hypothetical protein
MSGTAGIPAPSSRGGRQIFAYNLDADLRERMRLEISALVREAAATTVYITCPRAAASGPARRSSPSPGRPRWS